MKIASVAARMGFPLDAETTRYILSEAERRRNELCAKGDHHVGNDEIVEEVIGVVFGFDILTTGQG